MIKIAQIKVFQEKYHTAVGNLVRSGAVMDMNQRQIALSLLESLREGLIYAHLKQWQSHS